MDDVVMAQRLSSAKVDFISAASNPRSESQNSSNHHY